MQVRGRGQPAAMTAIRAWVAAVDRCLATIALTVVALVTLLLVRTLFCPRELPADE
jgi:hypothetical protein